MTPTTLQPDDVPDTVKSDLVSPLTGSLKIRPKLMVWLPVGVGDIGSNEETCGAVWSTSGPLTAAIFAATASRRAGRVA